MSSSAQKLPVRESVARVNEEVSVGEDLPFQRAWWRFEHLAWAFFTLVIVLDLAGAFGRGPLAHARAASADRELHLSYERIERTGTPSIMTIEFGAGAMQRGQVTLFVSDGVVSGLGAERIIPQPAVTRTGGGGLTYVFSAQSPPAVVRIALQPSGPGLFPFTLSAGSDQVVHGKVWVVP